MGAIFEELGVRPVLNAQGNRTLLGGSTPSASVRALMEEAEEYYVDMGELMERHAERVGDGAARPFLREVELLVEDSDRVTAAFLRSLPAPLLKGLPAKVAARAGS